jgi:hypothetical protein
MPANEMTALFDLPEFRLIPGERKASWGPELDDHVIEFACGTGLLTTDAARRYYQTQRFGTMCAYVVPGAITRRRYEIYGELMTWFFIYDDWAEQLGHYLSPEEVSELTDTVSTWFAEDEQDVRSLELPAARSMRGIWEKLQQDTSLEWRRRLRTELRGYLNTAADEAALVRTRRVNPFGKASELRPVATAARPVFTMAEHSYGVEIPQEVVRHPFLLQAGKTIAIAIAFANDIIGLKADLLRGIRDNLVLSLQEEYGRALPSGGRGILRPAYPVPLRRGPARPRPRPTTRRRRLPPNPRRLAVRGHQMATHGHRPLRHDHPTHPPGEPEPTPSPGRIPPITAARAALHEISGSACMRRWEALVAFPYRADRMTDTWRTPCSRPQRTRCRGRVRAVAPIFCHPLPLLRRRSAVSEGLPEPRERGVPPTGCCRWPICGCPARHRSTRVRGRSA